MAVFQGRSQVERSSPPRRTAGREYLRNWRGMEMAVCCLSFSTYVTKKYFSTYVTKKYFSTYVTKNYVKIIISFVQNTEKKV